MVILIRLRCEQAIFDTFYDVQLSQYTQSDLNYYMTNQVRHNLAIFRDGKFSSLAEKLIEELSSKAQGMYVFSSIAVEQRSPLTMFPHQVSICQAAASSL
jgi:hypothetical protein